MPLPMRTDSDNVGAEELFPFHIYTQESVLARHLSLVHVMVRILFEFVNLFLINIHTYNNGTSTSLTVRLFSSLSERQLRRGIAKARATNLALCN